MWLPRIGPSTAWAYRRLNEGLAVHPDGYDVNLEALAAWLGLGGGTGQNSPLVRSLRRLVRFCLALQVDEHVLAIRRRVPPITRPQLRQLHPTLQRTHLRLANPALPGAEPKRADAS